MNVDDALRDAEQSQLRPVYLVLGEESVLVDRVVEALRRACVAADPTGLNEERFVAGEVDVERILDAASTAPMFALRRSILVRNVERWETAKKRRVGSSPVDAPDDDTAEPNAPAGKAPTGPLDRLAAYATSPCPTTCLVLQATKLDNRRKLAAGALKGGYAVNCTSPARHQLPAFIRNAFQIRRVRIESEAAEALAELVGPDLASVLDAVERLALYVGADGVVGDEQVAACVTRVRLKTVWELGAAVGRRDAEAALRALDDVYNPQERGLPLVGILAWSLRQSLRFAEARAEGATPAEAGQRAGIPDFRVRDLAAQTARVPVAHLERCLSLLAEADLALKGSKRDPRAILETAILTMTGFRTR